VPTKLAREKALEEHLRILYNAANDVLTIFNEEKDHE